MRLLTVLFLIVGCGDDSAPSDGGGSDGGGSDVGMSDTSVDTAEDAPSVDSSTIADASTDTADLPRMIGGDRPARVVSSSAYDPATPTPLLILLHGYSANGGAQELYFNLSRKIRARNMLLVIPDGTVDSLGNRYWDATPGCCAFAGDPVDDVAYITGLIDEMKEFYNVDAGRVYLLGHSNGGFMSYRMACDAADQITAIASLAGSTFVDTERCDPARPVSVLQIHGTADLTIRYTGDGPRYPSAEETVARFATRAGCTESADGTALDFEAVLVGDETSPTEWTGCDAGLDAHLWTISAGGHLPVLSTTATDQILDWLLAHEF